MKHLSFILILSLVVVPATCLAKEGFIFYYDFNTDKEGKPPSKPWKPTAAGEIVVENFPSANNKSVKIKDSGSGGGMTLILDSPILDKTVSLEFKWMVKESAGDDVEIFYVMNQKCEDDFSGIDAKMSTGKGAILQHNDAGNWIGKEPIEHEKWHDFKYVIYVGKRKYDLYYDGKEMAKNAGFRKCMGIDGIDKFNAANVGNGGTSFIMYFDDIVFYEGNTRPLAVESEFKLTTTWGEIKDKNGK